MAFSTSAARDIQYFLNVCKISSHGSAALGRMASSVGEQQRSIRRSPPRNPRHENERSPPWFLTSHGFADCVRPRTRRGEVVGRGRVLCAKPLD